MYFEDKNFLAYSNLYEKARNLEKLKREDEALKIYLNILNRYSPKGIDYYERPAIILERRKMYKEAAEICRRAINVPWKEYFNCKPDMFEHRLTRLNNKIEKQKNSKVAIPKKRTTNKLVKHSSAMAITPIQAKEVSTKNIKFPDWYVSISFGESRSPSFPQALTLAQNAPQYIENNVSDKILYQAVYSDKPMEYLQFIKLYELISNWKSCFVIINGKIIDRKIIGGLNYCYGDKCRSGNPDFCFGASQMTANPFGCHRLQISAYNHPWWTIGDFITSSIWRVNKQAILERIKTYSLPYVMCPCFSIENIKTVVDSLPDTIDLRKNKRWEKSYNGIQPINHNVAFKLNISIDSKKDCTNTKKDKGFFAKLKSLFK